MTNHTPESSWPLSTNDDEETAARKLKARYPGLGLKKPFLNMEESVLQGAPPSRWHGLFYPRVEALIIEGANVSNVVSRVRQEILDDPISPKWLKDDILGRDQDSLRKQLYAWRKKERASQQAKVRFRTNDMFLELLHGSAEKAAEMFVSFSAPTRRKVIATLR